MTLYLKYRPQIIDELDLESVRNSIKEIALSKNIPHAFLLSGPKGTGKTSAARILAKIVNCENLGSNGEPCNKCEQCKAISKGFNIDVIELDAASNRGIDDIRSLRENIALSPAKAKKKVYIIDEAHMLTAEASNAFLKTLEEPPSHVIFVLATTEAYKLPETVRSRLTTIQFNKARASEISRQLERVIKGERLKVEKGVVEVIAKASDGSFRDAVKLLESLSLNRKKITKKDAKMALQEGAGSVQTLLKLFSEKNAKKILIEIQNISDAGASPKVYLEELIERLHLALLAKEGIGEGDLPEFEKAELIDLIELLLEARLVSSRSSIPELPLEIAVVRWCGSKNESSPKKEKAVERPKTSKSSNDAKDPVLNSQSIDELTWTKILSEVRTKNTTIEALLRAARPLGFDGKNLMIGVYYRFHKERLEVSQNKMALEGVAAQVLGFPIRISYELAEREKRLPKKEDLPLSSTKDQDIIEAAKEIFGDV
jgi:DNA polymerase-3 subunit gamma/tau